MVMRLSQENTRKEMFGYSATLLHLLNVENQQ